MFDLPPAFQHNEIPHVCVVQTLQQYQLPPELFIGYMAQEGGRVGTASRNSNGSTDYGPAQVNSAWLKELAPYGVTAHDLRWNACKNIWVSGWIMRKCLNKFAPDFWAGVGCYHAGAYPSRPEHFQRIRNYAIKVNRHARTYGPTFQRWLNAPQAFQAAQNAR